MSTSRRVLEQAAFLLHHRPFRDSSRILDVLSRDHGRLSLVARGSRSAKSKLKGVLRPFLPLKLSWYIRSDLGTLTGAEMNGEPVALAGDALLSGYYLNELLLNFLHRHDPQPEVYAIYAGTILGLAGKREVSAELRRFELALLRILGYAVNLDHDSRSQEPLIADANYEYRVEEGPVRIEGREGPMMFSGEILAAIGQEQFERAEVLRAARRLTREVLRFHLGGKELKSRKVLSDMRRAPGRPAAGAQAKQVR